MATFPRFPIDGYPYSASEVGAALAAFVRSTSAGMPTQGVLIDRDIVQAVTAAWRVRVIPFPYFQRVGGGYNVTISGVSEAEEHDIVPASGSIPSGQARIDLVCWNPTDAEVAVITGTPAASPSKPSSGGLVELATVRVNAGDGMVIASRITQTATKIDLKSPEPRVATGRVSKRNVNAGAVNNVTVTLPTGRFTSAPIVIAVGWGDARDMTVHVDNVTASSFLCRLGSMSTVRRTIGAQWRASQE